MNPQKLILEFGGRCMIRQPTDPDPYDERRGMSGYTFAFGDEPDLNRIIYFHEHPDFRVRSHCAKLGVYVTRAVVVGGDEPRAYPALEGAQFDLLGDPVLENRNWNLTRPGYEPIAPFHVQIRTPQISIDRLDVLDGVHPDQEPWKAPLEKLEAKGARGLELEPSTVGRATGVYDFPSVLGKRLEDLRTDLANLDQRLIDDPRRVVLEARIAHIADALANPDRRTAVFPIVERFGFAITGTEASVNGDPRLLPALDLSMDAQWRIDFWMGGWDFDALSCHVEGTLEIPLVSPGNKGDQTMHSHWHSHRHDHAKQERREREYPDVPATVFAKLGVTRADLSELEAGMYGHLTLPGMSDYSVLRKGKGLSVFDEGSPLIVFRCLDVEDVWLSLQATYRHGWSFTARSGGHSTAGFSSNAETIIDLSALDDMALIDESPEDAGASTRRVRVGAGATFKKLNRFMRLHRLHVPTGGCEDVCVGGYVQGGGWGYTSRQFGMQCDSIVEATVMLGDGRIVTASESINPALFWALRGGTGNNFGVLLDVVFRAVPMDSVWGFVYAWTGDAAPAAMIRARELFGPATGLDIGYSGNLVTIETPAGRVPAWLMSGICVKGRDVGAAALAPMLATGNPSTLYDNEGSYEEVNSAVEKKLPGIPLPIDGIYELKSSHYIPADISDQDWKACCNNIWRFFVDGIAKTNPYNMLYCETYGGRINERDPLDTAFVHRNVLMDIYVDAFWREDDPELHGYDAAQVWLDGVKAVLKPFENGHWYQNYPQREMPNYRWQYWGDAFPTLLAVKRAYDPLDRFSYEQSVTPYPGDPGVRKSDHAPIFESIVVEATDLTQSFATGT
jgi:hypothetical protein